ncbi:MAG TPA: DUF1987 domain-containing protein [Bacteroides sp.]|nr:DUF1987 domain-containing protein [Bacteroides sp.]
MEALRIEPTDDSPLVVLDRENNLFEISGKSLPENVVQFYRPVTEWLTAYQKDPGPETVFTFKLIYFNTASSKMILDILMLLEEMAEAGHEVTVRWMSLTSDEDMQEAGKEYEEMVDLPFEHHTYEFE